MCASPYVGKIGTGDESKYRNTFIDVEVTSLYCTLVTYSIQLIFMITCRGGDSYQKSGGGGGAKLCHISPGLFLEYKMQKGKKNEERNLNAWDRSFEKLDMPHT